MSTSTPPLRRPLPVIAVIGPVIAVLAVILVGLGGPGSRMGWVDAITAPGLVRWGRIAAMIAIPFSLLGAAVTRPGSGRRGFALDLMGVLLSVVAVLLA